MLELLRAAIHSRAAYGYAMQAGHVSSVLNFALMHAVHSFRCGRGFLVSSSHAEGAAESGRAALLQTLNDACCRRAQSSSCRATCHCSFDAAGGASVEANNEAVCVLSGIGGADILMAEWTNGVGRPCHYIAVDRASRQIVLSVRYASMPATASSKRAMDAACSLPEIYAGRGRCAAS